MGDHEWILVLGALALGLWPLVGKSAGIPRRGVLFGAVILALVGTLWAMSQFQQSQTRAVAAVPAAEPDQVMVDGYTSSKACRSCHPGQYATWFESYHRSMTQPADLENFLGPVDDFEMTIDDMTYRLERRGDRVWAMWHEAPMSKLQELDSSIQALQMARGQDRLAQSRRAAIDALIEEKKKEFEAAAMERVPIELPVVLLTGSHHQQVLWVEGKFKGELLSFPFLYLKAEERWVPRSAVFVRPPGPVNFGPWNNNCIKCHTTHGRPRPDFEAQTADTQVVEFGIACESCHGPAAEHLKANGSVTRRYSQHFEEDDETISTPEKFSPKSSSQICGHCHSVSHFKEADIFWQSGSTYRPGQDLFDVKAVIQPRADKLYGVTKDSVRMQSFWKDGVVRVTGREFNGLIDTGCYQKGEMACTSCHQLHGSNPDDQLGQGMRGDKACTQCHDTAKYAATAHTHHPAGSSGSECQNCHMPHTVYGLLKAVRTHTIESPSAKVTKETGRPNACNQCHIDRTLAWTSKHLNEWYGAPLVELDGEDKELSATLLGLLKGDAGQRALAAWALAWPEARQTAGDDWQAPFLAHSLDEPYEAVRYMIGRALRDLPGYEDFEFDFVAPEGQIKSSKDAALERWKARGAKPSKVGRHVLTDPQSGQPMTEEVESLRLRRDNSPITLPE